MQDVITREIMVKATQERVYRAISDPQQIVQWFPDEVLGGGLEPGERPIFVFSEHNHKAQTYIEDAKPYEYFAYRWVPGGASFDGDVLENPHTLVEFFIEEIPSGTKVTLKESGFASLPVEAAESSFKDNSGGWEYMIGRLEKVLNES